MSNTDPPSPRCDNYETYLTDEQGYAWAARDIVSVEDLEVHDGMLTHSEEQLRELVPADYDDFVRWAITRRWRQLDHLEKAVEVARTVVDGKRDHPAIDYPEATLAAIRLTEEAGRPDEALQLADELGDRAGEYRPYARLSQALIRLRRGADAERDRAREILDELHDDHSEDAELQFEITEDLAGSGFFELAREWGRRTRETAERTGNRAVRVDLDLLELPSDH